MKRDLLPLLMLLVVYPAFVSAGPIQDTLDGPGVRLITFKDREVGMRYEPYFEAGFRLLPACHYHINSANSYARWDSQWFSVDYSGCFDGPDSPGANPGGAELTLDRFGQPFHLLSLDLVSQEGGAISSRGGLAALQPDDPSGPSTGARTTGTQTFSGPEWRDVRWIEFSLGAFGEPCCGIDNVRLVAVSEPGMLALFIGTGLIGIGFARRRKTAW